MATLTLSVMPHVTPARHLHCIPLERTLIVTDFASLLRAALIRRRLIGGPLEPPVTTWTLVSGKTSTFELDETC